MHNRGLWVKDLQTLLTFCVCVWLGGGGGGGGVTGGRWIPLTKGQ